MEKAGSGTSLFDSALCAAPHRPRIVEFTPRRNQSAIVARSAGVDSACGLHTDQRIGEAGQRGSALRAQPSALERVLIDRICCCWLAMYEADGDESKLRSTPLPHRDNRIRRHDRVHGRFLSACKALAQVRKLLGVVAASSVKTLILDESGTKNQL